MFAISSIAQEVVDAVRAALDRNPAQRAILFDDRWYEWQWVREAARNLLGALRNADAQPDDVIGFVARNRPTGLAALLGLLSAPYSIRMVYAFQSSQALAKDVERIRLRHIILDEQDFVRPVVDALEATGTAAIVLRPDGSARSVGPPRGPSFRDETGPKPEIQLLTSGTTGPPKVHKTPFELIARRILRANVAASAFQTSTPVYAFFALGNISGIYSFVPPALAGIPIFMVEKFSTDSWLDWVRTFRPVGATLPPPAFRSILDAKVAKADLASLNAITTGSAPLDLDVQRSFEELYGIPILMSFGATEFSGPVASMTLELYATWGKRKMGSVGRAYAGACLRIVDSVSGVELPAGDEGAIEVRLDQSGHDWIRTSDIGIIDADGFVFHRGRADGAIIRGGFKMLPEAIERALLEHRGVAAVAVVGLPHDRLGQVPVAAIEMAVGWSGVTEAEIEKHLRARLTAPQIPVAYRIVNAIPRTPMLKLDLCAVRALFDDL